MRSAPALKLGWGEEAMAVTRQQKRMLFWGLGILIVLALMNVAWAQLAEGLGPCLKAL